MAVAVVGEFEPAGVSKHVGMHEEREFRRHAREAARRAPLSVAGYQRMVAS